MSAIESNKGNSSAFWRTIKGILPNKRKQVPNSVVIDGEQLGGPADIANAFNEHFSTIAERMANNSIRTSTTTSSVLEEGKKHNVAVTDHHHHHKFNKFTLSEVTEAFVQKQIDSIGKATGPDALSVKLLKLACPYAVSTLTYILNLSISFDQYPNAWKHASVIPIHKGGDKSCINNYRPISMHYPDRLQNFGEGSTQ